ncbi:MAG: hypothetical protein DRG59_12835 [Deltaproteobacteria bacterium]|nr:MAG: hypothetical protein DRG83_20985 [Deltaproteobacteria bacterium]RLB02328.1 MAG: hypothetical protein DRG59_12835 [Deltaproteobacteria bacterium]HEC31206.1 cell division protein ZapB [Deltaproteobacteria bacterium]
MGMDLFEKLEARIDKVLERDREFREQIQKLQSELARKEQVIEEYREDIRKLEAEKNEMKSRLDDIINKLDQMLNSAGEADGPSEGVDSWS